MIVGYIFFDAVYFFIGYSNKIYNIICDDNKMHQKKRIVKSIKVIVFIISYFIFYD